MVSLSFLVFVGGGGGRFLSSPRSVYSHVAFVDWGNESSRVILYGVQHDPVDGLTPVVRANRGQLVYLWFAHSPDVDRHIAN